MFQQTISDDEPQVDFKPATSENNTEYSSAERWIEYAFAAFLCAYAAGLLYLSKIQLLGFDEFLTLYTDKLPTLATLLKVQATTPVSLDPPAYHILAHWAILSGMNAAMAIRLPSLLGFLLMAVCVYLFVKRLVGIPVAVLTVCGLMTTNPVRYAIDARPYGILLGATGLALLLWQNAIRNRKREVSIVGLFLCIGLAISSHYFGILVGVPFLIAELYRMVVSRRMDRAIVTALMGSYVFVLTWLPFTKAAMQYRAHYYIKAHLAQIPDTYVAIFRFGTAILYLKVGEAVVLAALALYGCWCRYKGRNTEKTLYAEWIAIIALAALPIFGVLLALVTSGAYVVTRYAVEFSIGFLIAAMYGFVCLVNSRKITLFLVLCSFVMPMLLLLHLRIRANKQNAELFSYKLPPHASPTVVEGLDQFLFLNYYRPRFSTSSGLVFVYDEQQRFENNGGDDMERIEFSLHQFTTLPILSYNEFSSEYRRFSVLCFVPNGRICRVFFGHYGASLVPIGTVDKETLSEADLLAGEGSRVKP